tara:strand:+ start:95 stop:301 length:207 start_codon:yes stop_codon:yes gene_type:complete
MAISFDLLPEQMAFLKRIQEFVPKEILPQAFEIDEKSEFPKDFLRKLCTANTNNFIPVMTPKRVRVTW